MAVQRTCYQEKYNRNKVWEVADLDGAYYLRQYICGKQSGRGLRIKRKFIQSLGIFDFEEIGKESSFRQGHRKQHGVFAKEKQGCYKPLFRLMYSQTAPRGIFQVRPIRNTFISPAFRREYA